MQIEMWPIGRIKPNPRNPRTHSAKQVRQIANSIVAFGFTNPLLVDEDGVLIAGYGRYLAAGILRLAMVPVIVLAGLSPAKRRALAIADNKLADNAGWDRERLAIEIPELMELLPVEGLNVSILGFEPAEIDQLATDFEQDSADPAYNIDPQWVSAKPISQLGDLWKLGPHRILCGDARKLDRLKHLMGGGYADMAFLDPPYNVRVRDIVGRGSVKHQEFAMASGKCPQANSFAF